jgi:DnaJ-class molecular chaperone
MHVVLRVVVPSKLSGEQRRLLAELARTLPAPELPAKERSFVDKVKDILS